MNIAFCYESVLPNRGGCETYIASLARRLAVDGHELHLYACRWDASALPAAMHFHPIALPPCPRFLRPWFFGAACLRGLARAKHQVSVGFDKMTGLDVFYPQGGLHAAAAANNLLKYRSPLVRQTMRILKAIDPAHQSSLALERRQYRSSPRPLVIAISEMVRTHFQLYFHMDPRDLRMVRVATDPERFEARDRPRRRQEWREKWGATPTDTVALFAGMNYRLKGLEPLLHAVQRMWRDRPFLLLVAGSPKTADWERLARKLGVADRVRFVGYCSDMRNAYFAADFFVHPTFYDPCSNVVLEAMACGLPVITSRYNGASELMHPPQEGYVIDDPHDHERLAACMTQLLDPARRQACAQAARRTAAHWTFEHHYRQMLAVFTEAAARKQAA
jgi:UDP-glucose:(heptosyl)LPS alpha-1,3-glucosyltransferase